ncbi:MAG: OmpH family outer membrane protein [Paracoccaceae bacterium]
MAVGKQLWVMCLVIGALVSAGPAFAQNLGVTQSQIVTVDSELIFGSTVVGQGITTGLEEKVTALALENRRIASELEEEELDLTAQRKTMEPADFRVLATAFDQKVQRIRAEQDAKQRELQSQRDDERQSFVDAITPLLSGIAREHGALLVLERRNVLLSADSIDITQEVIDKIDAVLTIDAAGTLDGDAGTAEAATESSE